MSAGDPFCGKCEKPLVWARTEKGRDMPIDPEPVEGGNIVLQSIPGQSRQLAVVVKADPGVMRHVSHFFTCPEAKHYRKADRKRQATEGGPS